MTVAEESTTRHSPLVKSVTSPVFKFWMLSYHYARDPEQPLLTPLAASSPTNTYFWPLLLVAIPVAVSRTSTDSVAPETDTARMRVNSLQSLQSFAWHMGCRSSSLDRATEVLVDALQALVFPYLRVWLVEGAPSCRDRLVSRRRRADPKGISSLRQRFPAALRSF